MERLVHSPCGRTLPQHMNADCPDPHSPWWQPGPPISIRQAFAAWGDQHPGTHSFILFVPLIALGVAVAQLIGIQR